VNLELFERFLKHIAPLFESHAGLYCLRGWRNWQTRETLGSRRATCGGSIPFAYWHRQFFSQEDFFEGICLRAKIYIRILDIEIPKEDVENEYGKKLAKYKRDVSLPGSGPEKRPSISSRPVSATIYTESVEDLVERSFEDACKQHSIFPISKETQQPEGGRGSPVSFTIEFEVDPPGRSGDIKPRHRGRSENIKDADVEKALEELRERNAELKDVTRPAEKATAWHRVPQGRH